MSQNSEKHGTVQHAMGKLQDMVGGMAGRMAASAVTSAGTFVEKAASGDMYEIEAAKLALRRASSSEVKAFARTMLEDHTTSSHGLKAALEMNETKGVSAPPGQLETRHKKMLEHLDATRADQFDATYLDQQLLAHEETLTLMMSYFNKGDNPQLRSLAAGTAPVVARHLQRVKALKAQSPS